MSLPPSTPFAAWPSGDRESSDPAASGAGQVTDSERTPPLSVAFSLESVLGASDPARAALHRYPGPKAELESARARWRDAVSAGDPAEEARASTELARLLVAHGTELALAITLAERSLACREDTRLREELASWYRGLGDWALAAATLRPLLAHGSGQRRARLLVRIAALLGRAEDPAGAVSALLIAQGEDPEDPVAPELIGCVGGWASEVVEPARAAQAFLVAARRHAARGARGAAFEDLLRAFESAPDDGPACEELLGALESRARHVAADEVRREHVRAVGQAGRMLHARTVHEAAQAGDWARALGAALDADWDAEPDLDSALRAVGLKEPESTRHGFDELAERVGLYQLIAARLELVADTPPENGSAHLALGRLWAGPLEDLDRAVDAWLEALVCAPEASEALAELAGVGSTLRDQAPLVEALVRVGSDLDRLKARGGLVCLRELCRLVAEGPGDPAPIVWVSRCLSARGDRDEVLAELAERFAPLLELEEASLERIHERLPALSGAERVAVLRQLATLLRGRAEETKDYLGVLEELSRLLPEEPEWQRSLWRTLRRPGHHELRHAELARAAESAFSHADRVRARLELARLRHGFGDTPGAVELLRPLLGDPAAQAAGWSRALCYAASSGDRRWRANALLALSLALAPPVRAELACVAADDLFGSGDLAGARAAAEQALSADPSAGRASATLGRVAARMGAPDAASLVERALGVVAPRAWLCQALGDTYAAQGEPVLALTWTQRWLSLGPGCLGAVRASLERATAAGDVERSENAIAWVISQPLPTAEYADSLAAALRRLGELDRERARAVARRVLDALGAKHGALRAAVLDVAEQSGDTTLFALTLERSLEAENGATLFEHARRLAGLGDVARAERALCRAVALGADPAAVLELGQALPPTDSRQGVLDALKARVDALRALTPTPVSDMSRAWRAYGAALWDLADDQAGAIAAWREAAALDPEQGIERLVGDLGAFGGASAALAEIDRVARSGEHTVELPRLLGYGAYLAAGAGLESEALELAERALDLDPSDSNALAVAEQVAGPGETKALERIYQRLAEAALGRFGERAVHYRGARQLERRGSSELAFEHAVGAFEAVPSTGLTFRLLARLGRATGRIGEVVGVVERVGERTGDPAARAAWLELVAGHTGPSEEGIRQRCRALFAALSVEPTSARVAELAEAIRALLAICPEEQQILGLRIERATVALLPRLAGPEGARTAIAAAVLALDTGGGTELAATALARAARCDPSVEQYAPLVARVAELGRVPARARELVDLILAVARDRYGNAGRALCELGCVLGEVLGDRRASAELGLRAFERDPDDLGLVRRVEQAVLGVDDPELRAMWFETVPAARRAEALFELGVRRKEQGDNAGSVEAFRRALATPGLGDAERRAGLERLEGLLSLGGRAQALERLLEFAVDPRERIPWLRELGRLLAETDAVASVRRYEELLELDPEDQEALSALERDARERGDTAALGSLLGRRAALVSEPDERRRLVLGRAELLAGRLGQPDQARAELEELLGENGDDASVLAMLAEITERGGEAARAAELWHRACRSTPDAEQAVELGRRASQAWLDAGEKERARLVTRTLGSRMDPVAALRLRVEVERKIGKSIELGQALEDYARALPESDEQRTALLIEAARVAEAAGDSARALARAREAASLDPKAPGPALIAELLAYRQRGAGDPADATETIRTLEGLGGTLGPAQVELRSFLLAEALAGAGQPERARAELERAVLQCGPRPLLAARLAEELGRNQEYSAALPHFESALGGDLRGLRSRGKLAIQGALAAERGGDPERAMGWLRIALEDPDAVEQARALERLLGARREARARSAESSPSSAPIAVMRHAAPAAVEAPSGPPRRPTLPAFPPTNEEEARLVGELANGSAEAGFALLTRLEHRPNRAHDLLAACRQLASIVPGDLAVLASLAAAAAEDHNPTYAQAVEHVRRAFSVGDAPLSPPPLGEQREQPERVRSLLARDADAAGEALGLVWEHAPQVFRRDPLAYGVTGLERIQIGAPTPLARLYAAAARLLGMSRTPLFQRRDSVDVTVSVALLSPPAVLLAGDVRRESPELGYHLGAMLAACAPERVLLFGSDEQQARDILGALLVGFGPPSSQHRGPTASTHLAEVLWQSIPARAQRRLRELGDDPAAFQYEPAMASARRAVRRAGLLICGDLAVAVRETLADMSVELAPEPHGLDSLAERFPDVADLVRLATSPEYAEVRWQPGRTRPP